MTLVHIYMSTACFHATKTGQEELHRVCQTDAVRYNGTEKIAGQCKYCEAKCICECHKLGCKSD